VPIFRKLDVKKVIRLNEVKYERKKFIESGISHTDLFFVDGSNPSDDIIA
jgi:cell division cycle 14